MTRSYNIIFLLAIKNSREGRL